MPAPGEWLKVGNLLRISGTTRATLTVCAVLALAACGKEEKAVAKPSLTVSVTTAATQPLARSVEASGTVSAWEEAPVGAETGGLTAIGVYVDEGSYVRQGQTLVKLNDSVLASQLRQQDAQVASARATLAQADAALGRARELRQKGYLSQAALDASIAQQGTAAAQLAAAQAGRAETATRRDQTNVRAPVGGLIISRSVVKGQIVQPGVELFRLVRDGRLELDAQIPEDQLALVRAGMPATVTAGEAGVSGGTVRVVTPEVDPQTRLGVARIALAAPRAFRPGMFAKGVIDVGAQAALTVPQTSVVFRDNKAGVFVIDATNHARFLAVKTGARAGDRVEIVSGLAPGQRVAVQGAGFLADGDLVRVAPAAAPAAARR